MGDKTPQMGEQSQNKPEDMKPEKRSAKEAVSAVPPHHTNFYQLSSFKIVF